MFRAILIVLCLVFQTQPPFAETSFAAGMARIAVPAEIPFEVLVWYPTPEAEIPFQAGPYPVMARRDAGWASGRFPVVLMSHGSGGSPLAHRDLASHLARAGIIVVAPIHLGDSAGNTERRDVGLALQDRPRQAVEALRAAFADPQFAAHADPERLGSIGYSAGGFTALVLAGATPDFSRWPAYCREAPDNLELCGGVTETRYPGAGAAGWIPLREPRMRALVLMAPLAMPFSSDRLADVKRPILLLEATADLVVPSASNGDVLMGGILPLPQRQQVPGSHSVFIEPCPASLRSRLASICSDAPGVDRAALHASLREQITAFLKAQLK